jgi:hypothetical protein
VVEFSLKAGVGIPYKEIHTISVERSGATAIGAGVGASAGIVGGIILGVIGQQLQHFFSSPEPEIDQGKVMVAGAVGAVIGALIGGGIGAIIDIDTYKEVGGSADSYLETLPALRGNAVFPAFPPPELKSLTNP